MKCFKELMNNPEVILYNLNEVLLYTHYEIFGKRVIEASCHEIVLSSQYKDIQDIHHVSSCLERFSIK